MKRIYIVLLSLVALITQETGINAMAQSQEEIEFQEEVGFNQAIAQGDFTRAYNIASSLINLGLSTGNRNQISQGRRLNILIQVIEIEQHIERGDFIDAEQMINFLAKQRQADLANTLRGKLRAARGW